MHDSILGRIPNSTVSEMQPGMRSGSSESHHSQRELLLADEHKNPGMWSGWSSRAKYFIGGIFATVLLVGGTTTGVLLSQNNANSSNNSGGSRKYSLKLNTTDLYGVVTSQTANTMAVGLYNETYWEPMSEIELQFDDYINIEFLMGSAAYLEYMHDFRAEGTTLITCDQYGCTKNYDGTLDYMGNNSYSLNYNTPIGNCSAYSIQLYREDDQKYSCLTVTVEPGSTRLDPRVATQGDSRYNFILDPTIDWGRATISCTDNQNEPIGDATFQCDKQGSCTEEGDNLVMTATGHACAKELYIVNSDTNSTNNATTSWKKNPFGNSGIGRGTFPLFQQPRFPVKESSIAPVLENYLRRA